MLSKEEREYLLKIAREAIKAKLEGREYKPPKPPTRRLLNKQGVFVTIKERGDLRGCIGFIQPVASIVDSVVENAINAAFNDPRFPPLSKEEFDKITIEISVLSPLEEIPKEKFIDVLTPFKHGVVIEKGWHRATFLPQVWEELPNVEEFMAHLCMKAMLPPDEWKKSGMRFYIYTVEEFSENQS